MPVPEGLRDVIEHLARETGVHVGDISDEHERWRIYGKALDCPRVLAPLLSAIRHEPVASVASAVGVALLERVAPHARASVIAAIPGCHGRDYASARSADLAILESLLAGAYDPARHQVDQWSDWLQRRVADEADDGRVLAELAQGGRTKRVRRVAAERLRPRVREPCSGERASPQVDSEDLQEP